MSYLRGIDVDYTFPGQITKRPIPLRPLKLPHCPVCLESFPEVDDPKLRERQLGDHLVYKHSLHEVTHKLAAVQSQFRQLAEAAQVAQQALANLTHALQEPPE